MPLKPLLALLLLSVTFNASADDRSKGQVTESGHARRTFEAIKRKMVWPANVPHSGTITATVRYGDKGNVIEVIPGADHENRLIFDALKRAVQAASPLPAPLNKPCPPNGCEFTVVFNGAFF